VLTLPGAISQPVRDEGLQHGDGRRAARSRDDLRVAGQRRHRGEPRFLAQEGDELEIRVEAGLEPAIRLEQEPVAEHDARVRLVHPERPFLEARDGRGAARLQVAQPACRPADECPRD
jgi:hypothetical protein